MHAKGYTGCAAHDAWSAERGSYNFGAGFRIPLRLNLRVIHILSACRTAGRVEESFSNSPNLQSMDTTPNDDAQLLREFAADQSQSAFRTLVERYQDMVFGTARRRLGNDQAASDVSQNVFAALARKAPWLSARTSVGGWLY